MMPTEFYVTKAAIMNPSISSHVARVNEFTDGVRCYIADDIDKATELLGNGYTANLEAFNEILKIKDSQIRQYRDLTKLTSYFMYFILGLIALSQLLRFLNAN